MYYKVWRHPKKGDDYWTKFDSLSKAAKYSVKHEDAEPPLRGTGGGLKSMEYKISHSELSKALAKKTPKTRQVYKESNTWPSSKNPFW